MSGKAHVMKALREHFENDLNQEDIPQITLPEGELESGPSSNSLSSINPDN